MKSDRISDLKAILKETQNQLESVNNEYEALNIENNQQKRRIAELEY